MDEVAADLVAQARNGDRGALARVLSRLERGGDAARDVVRELHPFRNAAWIVGITGAPGAGKSTLTDALVAQLVDDDHRVGVLAIDPSSPFSGGAILGDRIRMQRHDTDDRVFIRSMATRGHLGGLASSTPQAARALGAARFDTVVIETVGVGQVEVEIAGHADTTVVVVNPGWGDAVQANKAGLMEIADIFVVNKSDRPGATDTVNEISNMLALASQRDWVPPIVQTVATTDRGLDELCEAMARHRSFMNEAMIEARRSARTRDEVRAVVTAIVAERAARRCQGDTFDRLIEAVDAGQLDPYQAAERIISDTP